MAAAETARITIGTRIVRSAKTAEITNVRTDGMKTVHKVRTAHRMKTVRRTIITHRMKIARTTTIVHSGTIVRKATTEENHIIRTATGRRTTDVILKAEKNGGNSQRIMMQNKLVHEHERVDELQRNGYSIIQDPGRFCFGMDAVLLSGFANVKKGEKALDLGTGTGIIPILLEAKTKGEHFTGLEIQPESADMAARSVQLNHLEERISIVTGDIKDASKRFGASSFDVVTTNPPYMIGQHGIANPKDAKAIARHEVLCTLDDILRESAKLLRPGGRFYMVHRPFRLAEIFSTMIEYRIEPKRMQLVYPYVDKEPNMVLIEGARGGKSRLTVEKPLIVYKAPGQYTDEIYSIYGY